MFKFFKRKIKGEFNSDELKIQMIRYSEEYVNHVEQKTEIRLDYSVESLGLIEKVLQQAHEMKNSLNAESKFWTITRTGAYISEVARKKYGGSYQFNKKLKKILLTVGEPKFKIHLLATDKVVGRIENGIEDNIVFFFCGFIGNVEEAKQGDEKYII